jgi:hypothetical protein
MTVLQDVRPQGFSFVERSDSEVEYFDIFVVVNEDFDRLYVWVNHVVVVYIGTRF